MGNYKHKTISLTIKNTEKIAEGQLRLPAGTCIGVVAENDGNGNSSPINLSIQDGGNEVVETMNYKFLKKTSGGRWTDSVMPIEFQCDMTIDVKISTVTAVTADTTIDVLFIIKKGNY